MTEPIYAKPTRTDRRKPCCINCGERLTRESKGAIGRYTFHHDSNWLERCPDYAQPRGVQL